ncbi:hypothetical protein PQD13_gp10 [Gordonia phage Clawz]|uniref:Uncharacterized protein n=1 Tax=Gordonia phage Clawz TaxID=2743910 RepID=A0AAE7F9K7_9CAUD|nr:hypothetical protein PQD13_gp10 [Gordonia phage Clawz]QKY79922.1 hypothetical protein SEA_CLAWZ_10 [Gordonia phage Clawz]
MKRGRKLRVGDRVLYPVRGTVERRDSWRGELHVRDDRTRECEVVSLRVAIGAERERIVRCRRCGMWRHRASPCGSCDALALLDDAPGGYGDGAR